MVNFHNLNVTQTDAVALDRFTHVFDGIFLWEFFTTMNFEWNYITRRRKFKWPLLLYSACRICALGGAICSLISADVTHEINCQQWNIWTFTFIGTAVVCASALITIRVIAVWAYNRLVTAVSILMYITNIGFLVYGVAVGRAKGGAKWSNVSKTCILDNTSQIRYNINTTTVTDITQLIIVLIGLLRSRREKRGFLRYLYIQGLLWLLTATLAEIPCAVFVNLNFNDPWNFILISQNFSFYTMIICATRMHRALVNYDIEAHKYPYGPNVTSSLQFGEQPRSGMSTGIGNFTALPTGQFHATFPRTKDSEISLAEKMARIGDQEAQSHKVLSIPAPENQYK